MVRRRRQQEGSRSLLRRSKSDGETTLLSSATRFPWMVLMVVFLTTCAPWRPKSDGEPFLREATTATTTEEVSTTTTKPLSLAYQHSYGLLDDVSDKEWERIRQKTLTTSIFKNSENPLERIEDADYWQANNLIPNFDCPHNTMIGGTSIKDDGVKFMCHPQRLIHDDNQNSPTTQKDDAPCLIYSIGCAGNYRFEDAMYDMHHGKCEIHVFDPAPNWGRKNDPTVKNIHYHAWGFKSTYDTESKSKVWPKGWGGGYKTFPETLKELGHENRTIDVLKIDCEGCEYSTYKDWIGMGFRHILVENHGVPTPSGPQNSRFFQKPLDLTLYYGEFQKHGYALFNRDEHGAVELAFLKLHPDFWKQSS